MREQANKIYLCQRSWQVQKKLPCHINNLTNMHSAAECPSIQTQFAPLPGDRFIQNTYPVTRRLNTRISHSSHTQLQGWSTAQLHDKQTPDSATQEPWLTKPHEHVRSFFERMRAWTSAIHEILLTSPHGYWICAGSTSIPYVYCIYVTPSTAVTQRSLTSTKRSTKSNSDGIRHIWMEHANNQTPINPGKTNLVGLLWTYLKKVL